MADTTADRLRDALRAKLDAEFDVILRGGIYASTVAARPDPDDQGFTIEKLYESILKLRTGLDWRVMREGIPSRDPETGEFCYYKLTAMPAMGTPEMWCVSTEAAEALISVLDENRT